DGGFRVHRTAAVQTRIRLDRGPAAADSRRRRARSGGAVLHRPVTWSGGDSVVGDMRHVTGLGGACAALARSELPDAGCPRCVARSGARRRPGVLAQAGDHHEVTLADPAARAVPRPTLGPRAAPAGSCPAGSLSPG